MHDTMPPLHPLPPPEARKLMEDIRGSAAEPEGNGLFPVLVYFHGGG